MLTTLARTFQVATRNDPKLGAMSKPAPMQPRDASWSSRQWISTFASRHI